MIDWKSTLCELSAERPVFHSEADFQHALAWKLRERHPDAYLRLEYRPFSDERVSVDIWMRTAEAAAAIELKYFTRKANVEVAGEHFNLRDQSAQDIRRYDFVKDISRLERIVAHHEDVSGHVILISNDSSYWSHSANRSTADAAFRIHEGSDLTGLLKWSELASAGTMRSREAVLHVQGRYVSAWNDYSEVPNERFGKFRYLLVDIVSESTEVSTKVITSPLKF